MPGTPREIDIIVAKDGTTTVEAVGFKGKGCKDATRPYEEALGTTVQDRPKPEIHHREVRQEDRNPLRRKA